MVKKLLQSGRMAAGQQFFLLQYIQKYKCFNNTPMNSSSSPCTKAPAAPPGSSCTLSCGTSWPGASSAQRRPLAHAPDRTSSAPRSCAVRFFCTQDYRWTIGATLDHWHIHPVPIGQRSVSDVLGYRAIPAGGVGLKF